MGSAPHLPKHIQAINIIQTELIVLIYLGIHTIKEKEVMHLKDNKGDYMGEVRGRKGKGGNVAIIISEIKFIQNFKLQLVHIILFIKSFQ